MLDLNVHIFAFVVEVCLAVLSSISDSKFLMKLACRCKEMRGHFEVLRDRQMNKILNGALLTLSNQNTLTVPDMKLFDGPELNLLILATIFSILLF